ncbi:helix-turn-helix domain-containing protein [Enterobacter bugandensis]|uniref:winged helix-turn-helix domain-containing protein n=1 Tax=Enterobacter bugandensis TaxID=881260 RepID=UPI0023B1B7A8|nr:helix-turn-helix domain-containing protein [Enterobacter bugandensis]MDE7590860.1 helix-turn-helix domain-containing protein [Enterobacter bugandensis]
MNKSIYGYLLNGNILFDIANKKIVYYSFEGADLPISFKVVTLSDTQSRLLFFLLANRKKEVIDKSEILNYVWDSFNLSSSSQRLWQTMNDLKKKLSYVSIPDSFIQNVYGAGYYIDDSVVAPLYVG